MRVGYFVRRSPNEELAEVRSANSGAWIHVSGRDINSDQLSEQLSLSPNIIRDVLDIHELPRVEFDLDAIYVFTRVPFGAIDSGKTAPLLIVIHRYNYITISPLVKFSPLEAGDFLTGVTTRPAGIFGANLAFIASVYEQRVHALTEKISRAKQRLSRFEVQNTDFIQFVAIEDSLNEYRSSLEGMLSVISQLQENRRHVFQLQELEALEDISLHIRQILVAIVSNIHAISSIQNAYSTISNNILNQRMKVLTAITILLAIPNVFYGMYGMNIGLPFQGEPWAYPVITGFTLLLILLVYLIAKRLRLF